MPVSRQFLVLSLNEGIQGKHVLIFALIITISSCYAGVLGVLQPALLQLMGVPKADQAILTGNLSAVHELVMIALMGVIGAWSDKVGRKTVYALGLITTSIGFACYPHASTLSELFLIRFVIATGSAAILAMMITLVADYAHNDSRGRANAIQGLLATVGAIGSPLIATLPGRFMQGGVTELSALQMTFAVVSAMGAAAACLAFFGLAPHVKRTIERIPLRRLIGEGLTAARDKQIMLSYAAAFISRGDLAVAGGFMSLWLVQFGVSELGMSATDAMIQLAVPTKLAIIGGALIGSVLMALFADRIGRVTMVALSAGLAGVAYCSVYFISDPSADSAKFLLVMMGVTEIAAFISSQALVGHLAPAQNRGAVIGFFGVCGAIGMLVATAGGGWAFSKIAPAAPFVLFGILNLLVCVCALALRAQQHNQGAEQLSAPG